jgi:hypothetical protein
MSDMWNSPNFNPVAPASNCHTDYIDAIDCLYDTVARDAFSCQPLHRKSKTYLCSREQDKEESESKDTGSAVL